MHWITLRHPGSVYLSLYKLARATGNHKIIPTQLTVHSTTLERSIHNHKLIGQSIAPKVTRNLIANKFDQQENFIGGCNWRQDVPNYAGIQRRHVHQATTSVPNIPSNASFKLLRGEVDSNAEDFRRNVEINTKRVERYVEALSFATAGGGAKAVERHTAKNRKLLVEDRLRLMFDGGECTLEVSPLAGMGMKYEDVPRAGVITAIGRISGVFCMVIANDATVKAGTIYPITLKKQLRSLEIAEQNSLPCVFVVDSGGAFLPLQADIFLPGGRTFYNEAVLNSLDVPQLAIVCGSCTAGAAYVPTMAQEAIIVNKIGTIFLAGPPLVHAALGEVVSPDDLGGARLHSTVSGCTDYFAETEAEAFEMGRSSVAAFNIVPVYNRAEFKEPVYDSEELHGIIPADGGNQSIDIYKVLARVVDGSLFHEFKANYARSIVTGFCHIHGYLVGVVGNNGFLTGDAALKASHFVQLCSQRLIPLVLLQNIVPEEDSTSVPQSITAAGVIGDKLRNQAKLMSCLACIDVPLLTVIIGNSIGCEAYMMGGRAFNPHFLFTWPNSRVCIDHPQRLAHLIAQSTVVDGKTVDESVHKKISEEVNQKSSAFYATSQGLDDGMIAPRDTREVLGHCLDIINQRKVNERPARAAGAVLRM